jgi:cytochrome c oxidase cbb3-type subunit II
MSTPPPVPRGWQRHPHERMLITPLVAGLGGLLAFFVVVAIVVWLPIHTFDPPPSADWAPLSDQARAGRNLFAQNGCYVCHSGYSRPQDVREALYFLYPKVSQPGDFYGSDQSPNLLGTERTGPDLSQESGWHPDDWQLAHFYDPRFMDPRSLMPDMKSLFSDKQVEQLVAYVEQRSGKSGLLRYAGQLYSKHVVLANQGFPEPYTGFTGAHNEIVESKPDSELTPPEGQLEEAPNLAQIDRSYWLAGDPLPVTEANLLRGKQVFLERCVGCHGLAGNGKGPGARFLSPPPADFTDKDDACCGGDTGPGDFYYRILRGWPGTAMENFGERLSVDDIWRVVLFVKTIPNHTLEKNRVPEPSDYISWAPSKELIAWLNSRQKLVDNVSFAKQQSSDPFMQEAMRVLPGLSTADKLMLNDRKTPLSLQDAANGIKAIYEDMLNRAWSDARDRGEKLPSESQKAIPPTVPGQQ